MLCCANMVTSSDQEGWRLEDGFVCADPLPDQPPPWGDLVALAPEATHGISLSLWPERAERIVAMQSALRNIPVDEFPNLVQDAQILRLFFKDDLEKLRDAYATYLETQKP